MKDFYNYIDSTVDDLLSHISTDIIKSVSEKTNIDSNTLASDVPGLLHTHWYISDTYVDECEFCSKVRRCNSHGQSDSQHASHDYPEGSG